jgi:hypothetical protein
MPPWILILIITSSSIGSMGTKVETTSVTSIPAFATQQACEAARYGYGGVETLASRCVKSGY